MPHACLKVAERVGLKRSPDEKTLEPREGWMLMRLTVTLSQYTGIKWLRRAPWTNAMFYVSYIAQ